MTKQSLPRKAVWEEKVSQSSYTFWHSSPFSETSQVGFSPSNHSGTSLRSAYFCLMRFPSSVRGSQYNHQVKILEVSISLTPGTTVNSEKPCGFSMRIFHPGDQTTNHTTIHEPAHTTLVGTRHGKMSEGKFIPALGTPLLCLHSPHHSNVKKHQLGPSRSFLLWLSVRPRSPHHSKVGTK